MEDLTKLGLGKRTLEKLSSLGIFTVEDLALKRIRDRIALAVFRASEWQTLVLHARMFLSNIYFDSSKVVIKSDELIEILNGDMLTVYSVLAIMNVTEEDVEVKAFNDNNYLIKPFFISDQSNTKTNEYRLAIFRNGVGRLKERLKLPNQRKLDTHMAQAELKIIARHEKIFNDYLNSLVSERLEQAINFGKAFRFSDFLEYLKSITGSLYEDSLLSLTQQVAISETAIVKEEEIKLTTGFNLAIFGSPGTGKSFASIDLVLGNQDEKIPPHGLPGLNRYCGGITAAQFIRIAQAYEGKKFNFIVPEFNEWFKYPGMVEILKQAMERKLLRYETTKFSISPYKFDSFFSVNYNTKIPENANTYETTINDPNYEAIEDRMVCRLHIMSKERFIKIIENLESSLLSKGSKFNASQLRDLITLIYAIQTKNQLVSQYFEPKVIELDEDYVKKLGVVTKNLINDLDTRIKFSPRLYKRSVQLYSAMALFEFFKSSKLKPSEEAKRFCIELYVQEALVRSNVPLTEDIIKKYLSEDNYLSYSSNANKSDLGSISSSSTTQVINSSDLGSNSESQFPDFLR